MFKKLTSAMEVKSLGSGIWTVLIFTFISTICLLKAIRFQYTNFIFTYPFISYDGFQWLSDGLHYLDRNIEATHRNPALPLMIAGLRSFGLVDSFPLAIAFVTIGFYFAAYYLVRSFFNPAISRITVFWFFFVFRIHNFFDFVLSDPWCLLLITLGLACFLRSTLQPKMLFGAAAAFGLAMNFQFAPAFAAPALIWFVFAGLGWRNLQTQRVISTWSVVLFLLLALPQFIYKWVFFGSPLYSRVIHFPLIRVHLFGLPYYALNLFAFLGWPLALIMLWGLKKSFGSRDPNWQLIHLYGLCMFLFWVIGYIWLDVRFLLYLIPTFLVYTAKGVEALDLPNRLSFRGKTPVQKFAIVAAIYFGISMSAFQANAFESTLLPLTPQMSLRLSTVSMTKWNVATLTLDKISTEHLDTNETLLNVLTHFRFYRKFARSPRAQSENFVKDVLSAAQIIEHETNSSERIGLCDDLFSAFETKMKIHFTIERNVGECDVRNNYLIIRNPSIKDMANKNPTYQPIWRGVELSILKQKS